MAVDSFCDFLRHHPVVDILITATAVVFIVSCVLYALGSTAYFIARSP